jgi:hypothetical protein
MNSCSSVPMFQEDCPCRKKKCERHGRCQQCREYHASNGKRPPYCLRKKSIWARWFGRG